MAKGRKKVDTYKNETLDIEIPIYLDTSLETWRFEAKMPDGSMLYAESGGELLDEIDQYIQKSMQLVWRAIIYVRMSEPSLGTGCNLYSDRLMIARVANSLVKVDWDHYHLPQRKPTEGVVKIDRIIGPDVQVALMKDGGIAPLPLHLASPFYGSGYEQHVFDYDEGLWDSLQAIELAIHHLDNRLRTLVSHDDISRIISATASLQRPLLESGDSDDE
jgi:hypothetical protein